MTKRRQKRAAALFMALLQAAVLAGCAGPRDMDTEASEDRLKIVCTIFPEYDWTRQILGAQEENTELTLLLQNGADLHSYQPTVWDMVKIAEADLFIYVGGESDFWVEDALANAEDPDMKVLNLMEVLEENIKEEEHVEGMQKARGHEHGAGEEEIPDGHDHESGEEEEPEYDEHVWLSLRNAETACGAIADALCGLDGEHSELYERNRDEYLSELDALDKAYAQAAEQADRPTLLFGDRFPFRYLTDDYGISYYAAFSGCSAETEASFETITFLAGKVDELALPAVLTIDGSDGKIARTIAGNTREQDAEVLMLDSMQSVSGEDIENGETYLSIMKKNLEVLKEALPKGGR